MKKSVIIIVSIIILSSCNMKKQTIARCNDTYDSELLNKIHCGKFEIVNASILNNALLEDTLVLKKSKSVELTNYNQSKLTIHFQDNFNSIRIIEYHLDSIVETKEGVSYVYKNKSFSGLFSIDEVTPSVNINSLYFYNSDNEVVISEKINIPNSTSDTLMYNLYWVNNLKKEDGIMMVKQKH